MAVQPSPRLLPSQGRRRVPSIPRAFRRPVEANHGVTLNRELHHHHVGTVRSCLQRAARRGRMPPSSMTSVGEKERSDVASLLSDGDNQRRADHQHDAIPSVAPPRQALPESSALSMGSDTGPVSASPDYVKSDGGSPVSSGPGVVPKALHVQHGCRSVCSSHRCF